MVEIIIRALYYKGSFSSGSRVCRVPGFRLRINPLLIVPPLMSSPVAVVGASSKV